MTRKASNRRNTEEMNNRVKSKVTKNAKVKKSKSISKSKVEFQTSNVILSSDELRKMIKHGL